LESVLKLIVAAVVERLGHWISTSDHDMSALGSALERVVAHLVAALALTVSLTLARSSAG
jgi:hypothetical protein